MVGNGGAVRRGDVAEIQIVALGVEEARLHYSDYELNEVPIERQGIRRSICDLNYMILLHFVTSFPD